MAGENFNEMGDIRSIRESVSALAAVVPATAGATAAKQDTGNTSLAAIAAGQAMFIATGTVLTRPANTTAYAANDSISNNATAGSVTALSVTVSDTNDAPIALEEILLDTTDTGLGTAAAIVRIHIFNQDPTASSGVVGGDNAAYSNKRGGWIGSFSGVMRAFSDGSVGVLVPDEGNLRLAGPGTGVKTLWFQLQAISAFTPSANSTTFTARFKGWQGRAPA